MEELSSVTNANAAGNGQKILSKNPLTLSTECANVYACKGEKPMQIVISRTIEQIVAHNETNFDVRIFQKHEIYDVTLLQDHGFEVDIQFDNGDISYNFPHNAYHILKENHEYPLLMD